MKNIILILLSLVILTSCKKDDIERKVDSDTGSVSFFQLSTTFKCNVTTTPVKKYQNVGLALSKDSAEKELFILYTEHFNGEYTFHAVHAGKYWYKSYNSLNSWENGTNC